MATYTLPRATYDLLTEALGEKQRAETFAKAMESVIEAIDNRAKEGIVEKKSQIKTELRDELRNELVTRELFEERFKVVDERFKTLDNKMEERFKTLENEMNGRFKILENEMNERFNVVDERFNVVDEKFKSLNFRLNIFIAIALIALTFANPTFVKLIEKVFGI
ncbi:MAG: hypothetical protein AB1422_05650 [bacterium]